MRNSVRVLLTCVALGLSSPSLGASDAAEVLMVQVYSIALRTEPSFVARPVPGKALSYQSKVVVLAHEGPWTRVRVPGRTKVEGWLPASALISQSQFEVRSGSRVEGSKNGVLTAGKGFNVGEQGTLSDSDKQMGLRRVEELEKIEISEESFQRFVREGRFQPASARAQP
jgi:hypothetical protein